MAVLVVATPCPLLIAIPVAIIGSISLAARRGIIVRDPAVLEQIDTCRTVIFDKTGTLTYGEPRLVEQLVSPDFKAHDVLTLAASLERYSKHPLSEAILLEAQRERLAPSEAEEIREKPGEGLRGKVAGRQVQITSRNKLAAQKPEFIDQLPPLAGGLECVILIDDRYAATYRFRDQPRREGSSFVHHLGPKHQFDRVMLVSGDRESEVRYLANQVGIREVYAEQSPEDKVNIVRRETEKANTLFLGDGINDAPALLAATVGMAFGTGNEITGDAAGAIVMDTSLERVDEFMHISRRMRKIALQKRHRRHGGQPDRHGHRRQWPFAPRGRCDPARSDRHSCSRKRRSRGLAAEIAHRFLGFGAQGTGFSTIGRLAADPTGRRTRCTPFSQQLNCIRAAALNAGPREEPRNTGHLRLHLASNPIILPDPLNSHFTHTRPPPHVALHTQSSPVFENHRRHRRCCRAHPVLAHQLHGESTK